MGSQRVRHDWANFIFTQFLKCLLINEAFSKIWSSIPAYTPIPLPCFVIKPKLILLATWQASKSSDELLGEGMATYLESQKIKNYGGLLAPKNHLAWVRIQASFILKGEGIKSNISWFWSAWKGDVLISSSKKPFTGGPGQDISCELNLRQSYQKRAILYNLSL